LKEGAVCFSFAFEGNSLLYEELGLFALVNLIAVVRDSRLAPKLTHIAGSQSVPPS
jgi:hypothetical protein